MHTSAALLSVGPIFGFAFVKLFLSQYIEALHNGVKNHFMDQVDNILDKDNIYCSNLRFYCLKLLRRHQPIKEIKVNFIVKKKVKWILKL